MAEQDLKKALEALGPDEDTRQRMLGNILAAHEASAQDDTSCQDDVSARDDASPQGNATAQSDAPAQRGALSQRIVASTQGDTPVDTETLTARPTRARRFSPIRYIMPIAACLLLAVITPLTLPQLAASFAPETTSISTGTGTGSGLGDTTTQGDANQPDGIRTEPDSSDPSQETAATPQSMAPLDIVVIALPSALCLGALVIALVGLRASRRD